MYVPVRVVAQNLGATVNWNSENQQVEIVSGSSTITLPLGARSATVDATQKDFDAVLVVMLNGSAHVGLRYVADLLG